MRIAKSPNVSSVRGSVMIRRSVPRTALTMPNSAETQTYPQKPPDTSMPESNHAVIAKAIAINAQRSR